MLKLQDRVKELTTTSGTGTLTLSGTAEAGFQAFSVLGNGTKTYYTISDVNGTDFEVGEGVYNANTLSRDTIFESSNSGNAISLSATGSTVFVTYPAEKSSYRDIGVNRDYTASGSITAGKPLILNADNTVSQVGVTPNVVNAGLGTETSDTTLGTRLSTAFGKDGQRVTAYRGATIGSGNYDVSIQVASVSTVDLKTIVWSGVSTVVQTTPAGVNGVGIIYHEDADKYIVAWRGSSGYLYGCALTVSGTGATATVSAGTQVALTSNNISGFKKNNMCYDTVNNFAILIYDDSTPKTRSLNISGTTLSAGTVATISTKSTSQTPVCAWNKYHGVVVYAYRDSSEDLYYNLATPNSNGTIPVSSSNEGTVDTVINYNMNSTVMSCDPDSGETVIIAYDPDNKKGQGGSTIWGTSGTRSGFVITWGALTQFSNVIGINANEYGGTDLAPIENGKMIYVMGTQTSSPTLPYRGIYSIITVSGTSLTYGTPTSYTDQYTYGVDFNSLGVDFSKTQALMTWKDTTVSNLHGIVLLQSQQTGSGTTNLTTDNYFGIASSTASTTEPVGVNRAGSFNNDQTGMTAGKDMYVTDAGLIKERVTTTTTPDTNPTISTITTQAGSTYSYWDNSIAYESTSGYYVRGRRDGSTNYPVVESGTWGSLSAGITWNTPTVLSSNSLRGQRIRVATGGGYAHCSYCTRENSNENAKVTPVAISGSGGLTLGTTTTVNTLATSGSSTQPTSIVYDTSQNTILAFFDLGWQSGYLHKVFPLQMSGANYSYSSSDAVTFASGIDMSAKSTNAIYDPDTNRIVFFYLLDAGTRTVNGIVFSCSGTTITQGSTQTASFTGTPNSNGYLTLAYDTQNNKIIIMYDVNLGAPSYLTYLPKYSIVTVTGGGTNTLSYTADAYAFSDTTQRTQVVSLAWNGDANKLFMVYGAYADSHTQCDTFTSNGSTLTSISSEELTTNTVVDSGSNETNASVFVTGQGVSYSLGGADSSPSILNFTLSLGSTTSTVVNGSQFVGTARSGTDLELAEPPTELVAMANGSITKGKPVIVKTDGDFEQVKQSITSVTFAQGSATELQEGWIDQRVISYDVNENKFLVAYRDQDNSTHGFCKVLSVSGTTVSYGSQSSAFNSNSTNVIDIVYDVESGNHVIFYQNSSQYGYAVVASISGTSVTFGTPVAFNSANTHYRGTCYYDSTNKKVVWVGGHFSGSYLLKAVVGTVSGTSITFGSLQDSGVSSTDYYSSAYDTNNSIGVYAYSDSSGDGYIGTLSISGTSITWNTPVNFNGSDNVQQKFDSMGYDSVNKKIVHFFKDAGTSSLQAIVGTVSGTSISFGTKVQAVSTADGGNTDNMATIGTLQGVMALVYRDARSGSGNGYLRYLQGTVSGTSISFAGGVLLDGTNTEGTPAIAYDSNNYGIVTSYGDISTHDLWALAVTPSGSLTTNNLLSTNFIGFAENTVADNEDVKVKVISQTDENQTGLTTASQYYVQTDGTLSTTAGTPSVLGGTALSSTKILIKS